MPWRFFNRPPASVTALEQMQQIAEAESPTAVAAEERAIRAQATLLEMMQVVVDATAKTEGRDDDRE